MSKMYLVETQSVHRMYYVVCTDNPTNNGSLQELVQSNQLRELGQEWLGEKVCGVQTIDEKQYLKKWNELNKEQEFVLENGTLAKGDKIPREEKLLYITNLDPPENSGKVIETIESYNDEIPNSLQG